MDDIRRRVEFDNVSLQIQAIEKLLSDIKKKQPTGQVLSSSMPETVEVKTLWQYTGVEQHVVARHACQVWLQLLQDRHADFTYVLNGLQNQVPSARNLQGIVEAIGHLLVLQVVLKVKAGGEYTCPYMIRSPPHPFITVVTNRPEAWPLIMEQVSTLFSLSQASVRGKALAVLDPFLKFVLIDPKCSEQYTSLRSALKVTLLNITMEMEYKEQKKELFGYLLDLLYKMQISTVSTLAETTQFCIQLLRFYGDEQTDFLECEGQRLGTYALSLCLKNHQMNQDFHSAARAIFVVTKHFPEVFAADVNLGILGQLLLVSYPPDTLALLSIAKKILQSSGKLSLFCTGFVAMAAINILAAPNLVSMSISYKAMTSLASEVVMLLEEKLSQSRSTPGTSRVDLQSRQITTDVYEAETCVQLANQFELNLSSIAPWLCYLQSHIRSMKNIPVGITNLVVSVLVIQSYTSVCRLAVDRLVDIAKQDPSQAPYLLPVFLYTLGKKSCPTLKLTLMEALPRLATHKFVVPPVLKTILSLGQSSKLKSLSIKLLTDIWTIQDRCFPHLLKAITNDGAGGTVTMATLKDDVMLARANAIKEVCRLRPQQHGSDMLAPLSKMLNDCSDEKSAPVAALALEGLYYICQAEVIDIMSAWRVLEGRLTKETRPVVVEKICELLSLVPGLQVKTDEYEVFLCETVRRLWLYTQMDNSSVVTAAYQALSNYSMEQFKISHFQYKIVEEYVLQGEAILAQSDNEADTIDSVIPFVPGLCYTRLLNQLRADTLDGFEAFLCSMVAREVESLPRGIYYTSLRQHGSSTNKGKAVAAIPALIQSKYEKTKQPGLRPGLAAGLLFCYDPPMEVSRDGRPRKHYAMSHGKNYQQMFASLLNDVPVQPSDWHRLMLMPQAWGNFMERLYGSMLQARKAEIDLQLSRDFIDEQEAEEKKSIAWLWVRDSLVDMVKKATKSNPSVQSNAVLALAGLTSACQRYAMGLEKEERKQADEVTEHTSHSHWLMIVVDSLMSLVDFTFKPKSSLMGLCQQRSIEDRLPASILAQASALLALCQLVPILTSHYIELVYSLVAMITERLPGQPDDEDHPPVLHTFHGLGLGVLLAKLVQESFSDVAGSKGGMLVMKTMDSLERCCFGPSEHRSGALLGLAVCLDALCKDGKTESRVHVTSMHGKLTESLLQTKPSDSVFQPLCMCVSMVTGSGFISNVINIDVADKTFTTLNKLCTKNSQSAGLLLSLGSLCYSLSVGSHPAIGQHMQTLYTDWMKSALNTDVSALERVACLTGLMAMVGSEKSQSMIDIVSSRTDGDVSQHTVITSASQIMASSDEIGIQGTAAWLLGNLYMSTCSTNHSTTTVPPSYSYLQESSVLRSVVDELILAGKQGPEIISSRQVEICLTSLQDEVTGTLPPLNWAGVLSPLMKLQFEDKVKLLCVQLAIKLCGSSTTAALFLSSWIVPPLFNTLTVPCQSAILYSCGQLMKAVTPAVLQIFLEKSCTDLFIQKKKHRQLCISALKGVNSALVVTDPPESVVAMLYRTVTRLFDLLESETDPAILGDLSECLKHVPDGVFDEITSEDCKSPAAILRGTYIRCYLVGKGHQPIPLLNSCIDAAFNESKCDKETVLSYLTHCFFEMTRVDSKNTHVLPRLQWLLEIMGHTRNIATGTFKLTNEQADIFEVISFAINIISAAICMWTSRTSAAMSSLDLDLFTSKSGDWTVEEHMTPEGHLMDMEAPDWSRGSHLILKPLNQLKNHIQRLNMEPWNQIIAKILDWLLVMQELPLLSAEIQSKLTDGLIALRHCSDFGKVAVWTKAVLV